MAEEMHLYLHLSELSNDSAMADGSGGKSQTQDTEDSSGSAKNIQRAAKSLVSYAAVSATANKLISYQISQVSLQTGATEYEQRLQANFSVAQQLISAGATIVAGAMTGGIWGAIAGMVVAGVQTAISVAQKENTLHTEKNLEDVSISMQRIRAGTAGRRGGNQ